MKTFKYLIGILIVVGIIFSLIDFEKYFGKLDTMADLIGYTFGYIYFILYGLWLVVSVTKRKKFYRKLYVIKFMSIVTSLLVSIACLTGIFVAIENEQITINNILLTIFSATAVIIFLAITILDIKLMANEIKNKEKANL